MTDRLDAIRARHLRRIRPGDARTRYVPDEVEADIEWLMDQLAVMRIRFDAQEQLVRELVGWDTRVRHGRRPLPIR